MANTPKTKSVTPVSPFADLPVLAKMKPADMAAKLRELGETKAGEAIEEELSGEGFGVISLRSVIDRILGRRIWMGTSHRFGFLPMSEQPSKQIAIHHAGAIKADKSLRNSPLKITLNQLRVADYPGGGTHRILFDFSAKNHVAKVTEELHFNSTFRVKQGQQAAVVGYPIFLGLNVGADGVAFSCRTVNVKNDGDESFLKFLESDVARSGLQLASVAQPALAPFAKLALGITKSIAERNRNVSVQDFFMGLDFEGSTLGARLAQGDYIVVQVPDDDEANWNWDDWIYDHQVGQIVKKNAGKELIPYNYIVFGVSRYHA